MGLPLHVRCTVLLFAALALLHPPSARGQELSWEEANEAGGQAMQRAQYDEAEKYFEAALRQAQFFVISDERLQITLNNLGAVYHERGKFAQSEALFTPWLEKFEKGLGPSSPIVFILLNNLGTVY
jgi:tetratricopeptide (TPR) repeat protein